MIGVTLILVAIINTKKSHWNIREDWLNMQQSKILCNHVMILVGFIKLTYFVWNECIVCRNISNPFPGPGDRHLLWDTGDTRFPIPSLRNLGNDDNVLSTISHFDFTASCSCVLLTALKTGQKQIIQREDETKSKAEITDRNWWCYKCRYSRTEICCYVEHSPSKDISYSSSKRNQTRNELRHCLETGIAIA